MNKKVKVEHNEVFNDYRALNDNEGSLDDPPRALLLAAVQERM